MAAMCGFLAACGGTTAVTPTPQPTAIPAAGQIFLDPEKQYQTIEGFGASGAWWAQDVGGWDEAVRQEITKLLFDREQGIGLTIYRYNIGAGAGENIRDEWRRTEGFAVEPGVYDWSRDAGAMWVLQTAVAYGVQHVVAFSNSPPAWLTLSGQVTGGQNGTTNITPENYEAYATYLIDIVRHLQEQGIPVKELSAINEPQWDWSHNNGQEGAHYAPAEAAALTRVLIEQIQAADLDVKISAVESGEWDGSQPYIEALMADPLIRETIDHFALHSYWSTADDKKRLARYMAQNYPDLPLVMSEWTEMVGGRSLSMSSALVMANTIHEDLVIGNVLSWQYWIAVSKYDYRDGLIYVQPFDQSYSITKRLWVLGNYSRFIQPGAVRLEAALAEEDALVRLSAWQHEERGETVMVLINNRADDLRLALPAVAGAAGMMVYETSAAHDLAEQYAGEPLLVYAFPAKSVTTIVWQRP
ncbi:MAG: xylanase [Ardenticatenaceae bacterium]|nr:xylanase [Ardenticatenaceae bacterium]